ncbi:MAG: hypothetical protein GSR77_01285 [Desulfurococcales archaeon]|nr:hypothetical protein [Desulfurococcales archaeon]
MKKGSIDPARDPKVVKKMAELMLRGAVMLADTCPLDGLPLFKLRNGDIVCPVHGKIILVHDEKEAEDLMIDNTLWKLETFAAKRIEGLMEQGKPSEIIEWLDVIEAVERIKSLRRPKTEKPQEIRTEKSAKRGSRER